MKKSIKKFILENVNPPPTSPTQQVSDPNLIRKTVKNSINGLSSQVGRLVLTHSLSKFGLNPTATGLSGMAQNVALSLPGLLLSKGITNKLIKDKPIPNNSTTPTNIQQPQNKNILNKDILAGPKKYIDKKFSPNTANLIKTAALPTALGLSTAGAYHAANNMGNPLRNAASEKLTDAMVSATDKSKEYIEKGLNMFGDNKGLAAGLITSPLALGTAFGAYKLWEIRRNMQKIKKEQEKKNLEAQKQLQQQQKNNNEDTILNATTSL